MTRCSIKKDFFFEDSFEVTLRDQDDIEAAERSTQTGRDTNTPLVEFCLPFAELKRIVDSMTDKENCMYIEYPYGDGKLKIDIPEEFKG